MEIYFTTSEFTRRGKSRCYLYYELNHVIMSNTPFIFYKLYHQNWEKSSLKSIGIAARILFSAPPDLLHYQTVKPPIIEYRIFLIPPERTYTRQGIAAWNGYRGNGKLSILLLTPILIGYSVWNLKVKSGSSIVDIVMISLSERLPTLPTTPVLMEYSCNGVLYMKLGITLGLDIKVEQWPFMAGIILLSPL